MPWFFPLITMVLFVLSAYLLNSKSEIETRTNLLITSFAYTVLTYIEVLGSLTTFGWFAFFELVTLLLLLLVHLFVPMGET
jgi:hypothetical protein